MTEQIKMETAFLEVKSNPSKLYSLEVPYLNVFIAVLTLLEDKTLTKYPNAIKNIRRKLEVVKTMHEYAITLN